VSAFRSEPIDRRRLNMRDRSDLNRGGGRQSEERAQRYLRAYKGQMDYEGKRQENTTPQTPGTGGMTQGLGIQQQRQREIGDANRRSEGFKPDLEENIYDIYEN